MTFSRIRLIEYMVLSILNILFSVQILKEDSIWQQIVAPFFYIGVFFVLFLYAPGAIALQALMKKAGVQSRFAMAAIPTVLFGVGASAVVISWSNPIESIGVVWLAITTSVLTIFVVNLRFLRSGV